MSKTTVFGLIFSFFFLGPSAAQNVNTFIPERAFQYLPVVHHEALRFTPEIPLGYYGALIELESCIHLRHSRCWSPTSEFKTSRERGAGLGQLTVAWTADGKVRFDSLTEMRNRYRTHLSELSWKSILSRPDLQIRAIALMTMQNWNALYMVRDPYQRLAMTDAAYNGGLGGVTNDRRLCGLKKGCDPQIWFGNVEFTSSKSRKVLYGNRSAFDINRHHVRDVLVVRRPKYDRYFQEKYEFIPRF